MEANDNELIKQFMQEQKREIPDNGFSRGVMRNLPSRQQHRFVRWWNLFCLFLGVVLFVVIDGVQLLVELLRNAYVCMMQYSGIHIDWKSVLVLSGTIFVFAIFKALKTSDV